MALAGSWWEEWLCCLFPDQGNYTCYLVTQPAGESQFLLDQKLDFGNTMTAGINLTLVHGTHLK